LEFEEVGYFKVGFGEETPLVVQFAVLQRRHDTEKLWTKKQTKIKSFAAKAL